MKRPFFFPRACLLALLLMLCPAASALAQTDSGGLVLKDYGSLGGAVDEQQFKPALAVRQPISRQQPTQSIDSARAEQKLLGRHMFSLQWISHEKFGIATVTRQDGIRLYIDARQELNGDYVTLKGDVRVADAKEFAVTGEIVTRVHHINGGNACIRQGTFVFKATGIRKYWRLQEMKNPCEDVLDYVDVFF